MRAVLCSWRFANDCLYKETVIRVPSSTWEQTKAPGWVKVCLDSQGDLLTRGPGETKKQTGKANKVCVPELPRKSEERNNVLEGPDVKREGGKVPTPTRVATPELA